MSQRRATRRTLSAAMLVGALVTALTGCGGGSTPTASTETAAAARPAVEIEPAANTAATSDSVLVECGMAQLTPRVAAGDPVLDRGRSFYQRMAATAQVPPAVQSVYGVDVDQLDADQRHELLLLLSSLNQCPGVSPELQQSILAVFDELAPDTVAVPTDADDPNESSLQAMQQSQQAIQDSAERQTEDSAEAVDEQLRYDSAGFSDYDSDGDWSGHGWWYRPCWTHPSTLRTDWNQWGQDRRDGIWWGWSGSRWLRFGVGRPSGPPLVGHHATDASTTSSWIPPSHGTPASTGFTGPTTQAWQGTRPAPSGSFPIPNQPSGSVGAPDPTHHGGAYFDPNQPQSRAPGTGPNDHVFHPPGTTYYAGPGPEPGVDRTHSDRTYQAPTGTSGTTPVPQHRFQTEPHRWSGSNPSGTTTNQFRSGTANQFDSGQSFHRSQPSTSANQFSRPSTTANQQQFQPRYQPAPAPAPRPAAPATGGAGGTWHH